MTTAMSLNIRKQMMADPRVHFPVMNRASSHEHTGHVTGPQPARLHQPINARHLSNALQQPINARHMNNELALYPVQYQQQTLRASASPPLTQSQQQILVNPELRNRTLQAAQSQQNMHLNLQVEPSLSRGTPSQLQQILLNRQVQTNPSQVMQSQQQIYFRPLVQPRTLQVTQSPQQMHHHHSQVQTSTTHAAQSQQQMHRYPQVQTSTSQVIQSQQQMRLHRQMQPSPSQVTQSQRPSVIVRHLNDPAQKPHPTPASHYFSNSNNPTKALVERRHAKSQRFRDHLYKAFLGDQSDEMRRYREAYLKLGVSIKDFEASSRRENAGCGKDGVPASSMSTKPGPSAKSSHNHLSQVDRRGLYELLKRKRAQWAGNSTLQSNSPRQKARDSSSSRQSTSLGDCGGYAVDHESFPIIVAVHSAGACAKDDVPTPRSPSRCIQEQAPQDDSNDVIITKVTFQGTESPRSQMKRSSPVHGHSQSKKMCIEPSPQFEQPPNVQVATTSPSHTAEEPQQENRGTYQQFAPAVNGSTESYQTPEQTYLPPPAHEIPDASREENNQTPSPLTNGYMNIQDFFESHAQETFEQGQESPNFLTASAAELDFGGPPPYLPLRESCEGTDQSACGSGPPVVAPQPCSESGANGISRTRSASQDQEEDFRKRATKTRKSTESHLEHSSEKIDEVPMIPKLPKKVYTLESLCSKIRHTRERTKNEEIPWKKKILYRLEASFIKRLVRMEKQTGKIADIDIPREELSKKKGKRRNSRLSTDKKEFSDAESEETRNSSNETEGKEEHLQKSPVDITQIENCNNDNAQTGMACATNNQEMLKHSKSQEKLDAVCPETATQNMNQEKLDAVCPEITTQNMNQEKLDAVCTETTKQNMNQETLDAVCPETTTQNMNQEKLDAVCTETTKQNMNQETLDAVCPETTTQNMDQEKLDAVCIETTKQSMNQETLYAVCPETTTQNMDQEKLDAVCIETTKQSMNQETLYAVCPETTTQNMDQEKLDAVCIETTKQSMNQETLYAVCPETTTQNMNEEKLHAVCPEITTQNMNQEKLDAVCTETTKQNMSQETLDAVCPKTTTQNMDQEKLDAVCPETTTPNMDQETLDAVCPETTTQNMDQEKPDAVCPETTKQNMNQETLGAVCPETTTQNMNQEKLDAVCPEITTQNMNQEKLDAVCPETMRRSYHQEKIENTFKLTDIDEESGGSLRQQIVVPDETLKPTINSERCCIRTFSSYKSTEIIRAVIKPFLYEKHGGPMKHRVSHQRGTVDKPKDYSTGNVHVTCSLEGKSRDTCVDDRTMPAWSKTKSGSDTCSLDENSKDSCVRDETLRLSEAKANPDCNRNIWSFLKTFTE